MSWLDDLAARFFGVKAAYPNVSEDGRYVVAPSLGWLSSYWPSATSAGVAISGDNALGLVAVSACVRVLSESVASLPLILYRREADERRERASDEPWYRTLHDVANPTMTAFTWRETTMGHLATWGNAFSQIVWRVGRPQLWPLKPWLVEIETKGGLPEYWGITGNGERKRLTDIFHVRGLSPDGWVGRSPIALHREALGLAAALQEFGAATMRNMARPATVLLAEKSMSLPAQERLALQLEKLKGSHNAGKTVVLEEGTQVKEIGFPPTDAQYIESRKFQLTEIARMFRVPPHMIGDLERSTNNNIEHQGLEFVTYTLAPWLKRIEQEIKLQLLTASSAEDLYAEFKVDALLRGDAKARNEALAIRWQHGTINADEWRALENENPLPDDLGKQYYVPANYKAVDDEPEPEPVQAVVDPAAEPEPGGRPQLVRVKAAEVRCPSCNRLLAEQATPPYRIACSRCKTVAELTAEVAAA